MKRNELLTQPTRAKWLRLEVLLRPAPAASRSVGICLSSRILCLAPRACIDIFSLMFIFNCYFRTLEIVWVVVFRGRCAHTDWNGWCCKKREFTESCQAVDHCSEYPELHLLKNNFPLSDLTLQLSELSVGHVWAEFFRPERKTFIFRKPATPPCQPLVCMWPVGSFEPSSVQTVLMGTGNWGGSAGERCCPTQQTPTCYFPALLQGSRAWAGSHTAHPCEGRSPARGEHTASTSRRQRTVSCPNPPPQIGKRCCSPVLLVWAVSSLVC